MKGFTFSILRKFTCNAEGPVKRFEWELADIHCIFLNLFFRSDVWKILHREKFDLFDLIFRNQPNVVNDLRGVNERTLLMEAVIANNYDYVHSLAKKKKKDQRKSKLFDSMAIYLDHKRTPHCAENFGDQTMIDFLLKNDGCRRHVQDSDGTTPLYIAEKYGKISTIELLLKIGADPNVKDVNNKTVFHIAARFGHLNVMSVLLEKDSRESNTQGIDGMTPLHIAVKYGKTLMVELLLKRGADPNVKNAEGRTADQLTNMREIKRLFRCQQIK